MLENKNYIDTYIYRLYPKYEQELFEFVMKSTRINTLGDNFRDIVFDVRRRKISDTLVKFISSPNVVLGINEGHTLPKSFKTFVSKDVREDKSKIKVFIDVTGVIREENGVYICNHIEWLISYLIDAMVAFIYTMQPNSLLNNASIKIDGGDCFIRFFSYIMDRLYKISAVPQKKKQVDYVSAIYYQVNILGKDFDKFYDSIIQNAEKMADIEKRDASVVNALFVKEDFANIDLFAKSLSRLGFKDMRLDNIISYWMNAFGTGTVFGLEYFPSFSAMLTDCYIGGYLNSQITIEKLASTSMVKFTKTIISIGERV